VLLLSSMMTVALLSGYSSDVSGASYGVSSYPVIKGCSISQRFDHYDLLRKDGTSFRDFYQNWEDIFSKNSCQQQDIFDLRRQISGVRDATRLKIFKCEGGGIEKLTTKLHELEFELEYVRNVMDTNDEKPDPSGKKAVAFHPDKVMLLMQESRFVKNQVIPMERMNELFGELRQKYSKRVQAYSNCSDKDFEALGEKWNNFTESWAGLSPAVKDASKKTKKEFNTVLYTPSEKIDNFSKGLLDVRVNDVSPRQNFTNLYRQLSGYDSKTGKTGTPPTSWEFLDKALNEESRYDSELSRAEKGARYEFVYGHVSDAAVLAIVGEIKELNGVIESTLPPMTRARACVREITKLQCNGK